VKNSLLIGIRVFLVAFLGLGIAYPPFVTGVAHVAMPRNATGSFVKGPDGATVGSTLIGQAFSAPGYFHPRPSASDYDALASGGTNLGPTSRKLADRMNEAASAFGTAPVPADAVTASASGLDPDISPANAYAQIERVAAARRLSAREVRRLVDDISKGRDLGFIGEPRVDVLQLNLALDRAFGARR
jgi:K+-transporting ATPase ATPase C chain